MTTVLLKHRPLLLCRAIIVHEVESALPIVHVASIMFVWCLVTCAAASVAILWEIDVDLVKSVV